METERIEFEAPSKRIKTTMEEKEKETVEKEETETGAVASEEMELNITNIFEKIERFTEMVSELLESGKTMFKELSNEFEERLIMMHKEQIEKWQEEIQELRLLDSSNEEATAVLHNARFLLHNSHIES